MSEFRRAKVDKGSGDILLTAGDYFIDTHEDDLIDVLPELSRYVPQTYIREQVGSGGRGNVMVSFRIPSQMRIPNAVAAQTGWWFEVPKGKTLRQISAQLYGPDATEPMGFWEWLATDHPRVLTTVKKAAEAIKETGEAVAKVADDQAMRVLKYAGAALVVVLLFRLITTPRRQAAPEPVDY